MKFGMNMLLWTAEVTEDHLPVLQKLKDLGYDGVEMPVFSPEVEKYEKIAKHLDSLGLERTAVTVRTVEENPISPEAGVRAKGIAANKQALDCCAAMGAKILCGPFHSALGHFTGTGPTEQEKEWAVEGLREMAEHAAKCDVTLAIEYLNRFECYLLNSAEDTVELIEKVDHPNCQLMYDTFHANIEEKDAGVAIRRCMNHLAHVHISENDRSTPGKGNIRWEETFDTLKAVGYNGWLMVEAFGLALPELAAATKIWRKMYETEEQLARDAVEFMKSEWEKRSN